MDIPHDTQPRDQPVACSRCNRRTWAADAICDRCRFEARP